MTYNTYTENSENYPEDQNTNPEVTLESQVAALEVPRQMLPTLYPMDQLPMQPTRREFDQLAAQAEYLRGALEKALKAQAAAQEEARKFALIAQEATERANIQLRSNIEAQKRLPHSTMIQTSGVSKGNFNTQRRETGKSVNLDRDLSGGSCGLDVAGNRGSSRVKGRGDLVWDKPRTSSREGARSGRVAVPREAAAREDRRRLTRSRSVTRSRSRSRVNRRRGRSGSRSSDELRRGKRKESEREFREKSFEGSVILSGRAGEDLSSTLR